MFTFSIKYMNSTKAARFAKINRNRGKQQADIVQAPSLFCRRRRSSSPRVQIGVIVPEATTIIFDNAKAHAYRSVK